MKEFTSEFKTEVYKYHKNLHDTDRGYGGSIMKRVRERFEITGEEVSEIVKEMREKESNPPSPTVHTGQEQEGLSKGEHTPGKIVVKNGKWYTEKGDIFFTNWREGSNNKEEAKANVARLVTCWNEYDNLKAENEQYKKQSFESSELIHKLKAANKQLYEALKDLFEEHVAMHRIDTEGESWLNTVTHNAKEALNNNPLK